MITFMKALFLCVFTLFIAACTKNPEPAPQVPAPVQRKITQPALLPGLKSAHFGKVLREAIYFSNSLEREALKLILKDPSFQRLTLFSALSYIAETDSGVRKSMPYGLDCGQYEIRPEPGSLVVFKSCFKPSPEVARIRVLEEDKSYEIEFATREWGSVIGVPTSLTGSNITCGLKITDKKLQGLNCENWAYLTSEDQLSSTVLKAKEFRFQRDAQKQFVIKGGFFKELIENKKIDITVPLEGKIKVFEKELLVIDEFAEKKEENHEKKPTLQKISEDASAPDFQNQNQNQNEEGRQESNPEKTDLGLPAENQGPQPVPEETQPTPNPRPGRGSR